MKRGEVYVWCLLHVVGRGGVGAWHCTLHATAALNMQYKYQFRQWGTPLLVTRGMCILQRMIEKEEKDETADR